MRDAWKTEAAKDAAKDAPKTEAKENKKGPRTRRSRSRSPMRGGISRDRSRSRSRERIPDPDPAPAPAAAPVKGKEGKEEKEPYIVEYQKKQKTTTTQDVITVGRRDGCDVVLSQSTSKNGVSRIHAIICLIPEFNKVVVVDPGSFHGITAVTAGELPDGKHDEKKTPIVGGADTEHKLRGVAVFDYSSTVCLKLGKVPIVLNPKMCVICCTRTRNVKFSCGHQVSCNECAEHIRETAARQRDMGYKCPLCRALLTQPPMAVQFVCISHASSF
jgi:hypothetical protein